MPRRTSDRVDKLIEEEFRHLEDQFVLSEGELSSEKLIRLERLARFRSLRKDLQTPSRPRRWTPIILFALTALLVSCLLFIRTPTAEIELDVHVKGVSFSLGADLVLLEPMNLAALRASGLDEIRLPQRQFSSGDNTLRASGVPIDVEITIASIGDALTLQIPPLASGSRISVRATDSDRRCLLSIDGMPSALSVSFYRPVILGRSGGSSDTLRTNAPTCLTLFPGKSGVDLDLVPMSGSNVMLYPQLPVNDLSFSLYDEYVDEQRTIFKTVSTVNAGTLYLESINGKAISLRAGERLRFASSSGVLRSATVSDGQDLHILFHGQARGMTTGTLENPRNLMPSCLDWLRARHSMSLFWGSILFLYSLLASLARWWRTGK